MIPDPPPPDLRAHATLGPEDEGPDVAGLRARLAVDLGDVLGEEDKIGRFGDAWDNDDDGDEE